MVIDILTLVFCVIALAITVFVMYTHHNAPQVLDESVERERLLRIVKNLRLSDMLGLLNISLGRYIQFVPVDEIKRHISICRGCTGLDVCDRCLKKGVQEKDMSFCLNHQSLLVHARSFRK